MVESRRRVCHGARKALAVAAPTSDEAEDDDRLRSWA